MFTTLAVAALAVTSVVVAAPTPDGPSPGTVFNSQSQCAISWTADTDTVKPWTNMTIELMTGTNAQMTHMRTIANVDATKTTSFTWTCPDVDLNAPIYFYQFSSPVAPSALQWTGRWTLASESGATVSAPNTDSAGIKWGLGHFTDSSLYNTIPAYLNGNGQLQGAPGSGNGTTPASTMSGSSPATSTGGVTPSTSGTSTPASGTMTMTTSHSGSSAPTTSATQSTTQKSGGVQAFGVSSLASFLAFVVAGASAAVAF